jgi:ATP-dependent Lhr-like helicase
LYLTDHYPLLAQPMEAVDGELALKVRTLLHERGALFFTEMATRTGAFQQDLMRVLWDMVWAGELTNDTPAPLRSMLRAAGGQSRSVKVRGRTFRSRRSLPPASEGRWSLLPATEGGPTPTEKRAALARTLLERHGVLTREAVHAEGVPGGFSAVYEVLKAMEDSGRVRRGYFVDGLGVTQFALPGADDRLRALKNEPDEKRTVMLAATDPANPYGAALAWPEKDGTRPTRSAGAQVILHDGALVAYARRTERNVLTFLPEGEPARSDAAAAVARTLASLVDDGQRKALLVGQVDGGEPGESALADPLAEQGFRPGMRGYLKRGGPSGLPS